MKQEANNRILLVEDSAVYRRLISRHLREWGFDVAVAKTGLEGWAVLEKPGSPALALLDWIMPGMDGVELCRKIRQRGPGEQYIYSILLTIKEGRTDLLKAMEAGADDYLVKPFDEQELRARVLVGCRIVQLQRDLVAAREAMRNAATYYLLTGLLNRREILARLKQELDRCSREDKPASIIIADIDHFKAVNDEMGHLAGDEVLAEVGRRLQSSTRSYDAVGRYGGEEFLLVLPGCDFLPTFRRADQIRTSIANAPVVTSAGRRTVTLSMGIAVTEGRGEQDLQALLLRADAALYEAKRKGRNRVELANQHKTAAEAQSSTIDSPDSLRLRPFGNEIPRFVSPGNLFLK